MKGKKKVYKAWLGIPNYKRHRFSWQSLLSEESKRKKSNWFAYKETRETNGGSRPEGRKPALGWVGRLMENSKLKNCESTEGETIVCLRSIIVIALERNSPKPPTFLFLSPSFPLHLQNPLSYVILE